MDIDACRVRTSHLKGEAATYSQVTLAGRLALLLLVAGNDHAASSRLARHPANHAHGLDQLRFLG